MDDVVEASGILRATLKSWRKRSYPALTSIEAVYNALGWQFIAVPAHVEVLTPTVASKIAEVSALAQMEMTEVWATAVQLAARQLAASEQGARILAELDAEREAQRAALRRRKSAANDNNVRAETAA